MCRENNSNQTMHVTIIQHNFIDKDWKAHLYIITMKICSKSDVKCHKRCVDPSTWQPCLGTRLGVIYLLPLTHWSLTHQLPIQVDHNLRQQITTTERKYGGAFYWQGRQVGEGTSSHQYCLELFIRGYTATNENVVNSLTSTCQRKAIGATVTSMAMAVLNFVLSKFPKFIYTNP